MEDYFKHYDEEYRPPSTEVLLEWMEQFRLSHKELARIIERSPGYVTKLLLDEDSRDKARLSCAETQLFLLRTGLAEYKPLEKPVNKDEDYWYEFKKIIRINKITLAQVSRELGYARTYIYNIKNDKEKFLDLVVQLPLFRDLERFKDK